MAAIRDAMHDNLTRSEKEERSIAIHHEPNHTRARNRRSFIKWASVMPQTKTLSTSASEHSFAFSVGVAAPNRMNSLSKLATLGKGADAFAPIKIIGIGGAGCKCVERLLQAELQGADLIVADTDAHLLNRTEARGRLLFEATGLNSNTGAEFGWTAANAHRREIRESLTGAKMVFIVAGMGGSTGAGAATVVAEVAGKMGALTIGVVFKPSILEGNERMKSADEGIAELVKHVDSLLVIPNDKQMQSVGSESYIDNGFYPPDELSKYTIAGIIEMIACPCLVNVHFEDVCNILKKRELTKAGFAYASGVDRARFAAEQAVTSILSAGTSPLRPKGMIVNITTARAGLKMEEVNEVINTVKLFTAEDACIIFGVVLDESMVDVMRVTLVASGI